jgi:lauroyl/myristoyl acyltransferase
MNPKVEYAIGRVRGLLPIPLTRLLVAVRWRLGWRNPAVREQAIAHMRFLLEHTRPDADVEDAAKRYLRRMAWRGELRWHLRTVTHPRLVGLEHLKQARDLGRGVVLNFLHFGQYEGAGAPINRGGVRLHQIVLPIHFAPDREGWMIQHMRIADAAGGINIRSDAGSQAFADVLTGGGVLYLASDVPGRTPVRFVGRDLLGSFGAALLATKAGSAVVVVTQELDHPNAVMPTVRIHPPLFPEDFEEPRGLLEAMLAIHEDAVTRFPELYDLPLTRWGQPSDEAQEGAA